MVVQYHSAEEESVGIGSFERTHYAANFFPKFPKPLRQEGFGPGDLISRKAIQHAVATSSAVQGIIALSQVRSSLQKCFIKSEIMASAIVRCYRGECDLQWIETFVIRGAFDSAFPCHLLFLLVPIFSRTYLCLFLKISHTSIIAAHSVFICQNERPQGRMPLRDIEILHSRSSHLQHPIPHLSCCLCLLTALAAESPNHFAS